jgi:two-component system sensor histidine kinase KdpD
LRADGVPPGKDPPVQGEIEMFAPFQRLGDTDPATGIGLGLAVSRGLTMTISVLAAPRPAPDS